MKTFKTPYNYDLERGELNTQPSLTIPDQSLTVQQLLKRHSQGLSLGGHEKVGMYEEDLLDNMTTAEFQRLDLAEQEQIIARRHQEVEDIKQKAREAEKQARDFAHQKRLKEAEQARQRHREQRERQDAPRAPQAPERGEQH